MKLSTKVSRIRLPGFTLLLMFFGSLPASVPGFYRRGAAVHLNGRKLFTRGRKLWSGKCKNGSAKNNIRHVFFTNFRKTFLFTRIFFIQGFVAKLIFYWWRRICESKILLNAALKCRCIIFWYVKFVFTFFWDNLNALYYETELFMSYQNLQQCRALWSWNLYSIICLEFQGRLFQLFSDRKVENIKWFVEQWKYHSISQKRR